MPLFMFYVWERDYFGTTHLPSATTSPKAELDKTTDKRDNGDWFANRSNTIKLRYTREKHDQESTAFK